MFVPANIEGKGDRIYPDEIVFCRMVTLTIVCFLNRFLCTESWTALSLM